MPKPSSVIQWAEGVLAKIKEPSSGKKDVGWVSEEKLPEGFINWFWNLTGQWTQYLNNLENEALTWIAKQVFRQMELVSDFNVAPLVARGRSPQDTLARFIIDHNGFPLGRYYHNDIFWDFGGPAATEDISVTQSPLSINSVSVPWRFSKFETGGRIRFYKAGALPADLDHIGTGAIGITSPSAGRSILSHRSLEVASGFMLDDATKVVLEFELAVASSYTNADIRIGFLDSTLLPDPFVSDWDSNAHLGLRKNAADANWFLTYQDTGAITDTVDLGPLSLDQWYTVRIEYTPQSNNNSFASVYIDGSIAGGTGFAIRMPAGNDGINLGYPVILIQENGGASTAEVIIGPMRIRHNMFQTSYEF